MADDVSLKLVLLGEDRSAGKTLGGVGKAAKVALAVAGAAAVKFAGDSVEAFREADRSQRELEDAYERFPALGDVNIDKMRELNQAIQDKVGADADDLASSQAVLARHRLTGEQIAKMTPLLVDYAARTGKDLPDAANTLGKAMAGNAKAMKELGIPFKATGDAATDFEAIMGGLQEKVGGFAEKEAATLDGKMKILETKFGDVQEKVGEALVPVLEKLVDVGSDVIKYVEENADWLGPLATGLGIAAGAIAAIVGVTRAWAAVQTAMNAVMAANPIGLVVLAIAALVAGLVWAYNESEEFRKVVDAAFSAVAEAGRWLWNNALAPVIRFIVNGFATVVEGIAAFLDALGNIPGFEWAKTAADQMKGTAKQAREIADGIKDIPPKKNVNVNIDVTKSGVRQIDITPIKGGGGWKISKFDKGGRPNVGELAMFHADELWVPDGPGTVLTKSQTQRVLGNGPVPLGGIGGGGVVVVNHNYDVDMSGLIDTGDAGRRLERLLSSHRMNALNGAPLAFMR